MAKIISYAHLNKKYNLNFTDNNFGFTWEIFKEMVTDVWAPFFTSSCFYRVQPTARNLFKTTVHTIFAIFMAVNFTDTSSKMLRRYDNTHLITTHGKLMEITQLLLDKYGIDFTEYNKNGIKWKLRDSGGFIKFPSGSVISFGGYTNGSSVMGATVQGSPVFMTWTDEFVDPNEVEPLTDKELIDRYQRLEISILKNQIQKRSFKAIKEWSWTFVDQDYLSPTYGKKITRYFHKVPFNSFSFNRYDDDHIIFKKYVTPFLPAEKSDDLLDKSGLVIYENNTEFNNLGLFIMKATMKITWDLLDQFMKNYILRIKEEDPDEYKTIYEGKEYGISDMSNFVYRRQINYPLPYNLNDFFITAFDKFQFDFHSIGVDWATGPTDNTIFHFYGFKKGNGKMFINWNDVPLTRKCFRNLKFDKNKTNMPDKNMMQDPSDAYFYALYPYRYKTLKYDTYLICEIVVTPEMNLTETEKTKFFVEAILGLRDHFVNFSTTRFHYDDKAESSMKWIEDELEINHGYLIKTSKAIKHNSQLNNEAGLTDRVTWIRRRLENRPYNKPLKEPKSIVLLSQKK